MLIVLAIWEAAHRIPDSNSAHIEGTPIAGLSSCTSSNPPNGSSIFTITNVIGAGDLQKEEVDLKYTGSGMFCMRGWQLVGSSTRFDFPDYFQFYSSDVVIKIYSRAGTSTPLELYWGLTSPIWRSGSTVKLLDSNGREQASFKIP